jgi:transcription termination factor Rho
MLFDPQEYRLITVLRRVLSEMSPTDSMELLTSKMAKTKTNAEFLMSMNGR